MFADEVINEGAYTLFNGGGRFTAFEFEGYKKEIIASKETAYIGTSLNGSSPIVDIVGPDALAFLRSVCVNSFNNFEVGRIRHGIICDENGYILGDGVIAHIEEGVYRTYWLAPAIDFRLTQTDLDVQGIDRTGTEFFFQVAGPRSLEILEAASRSDLHDIRFARHRESSIAGVPVRVLRLGMAGTLAYEVHGDMADAETVYRALLAAGEPFGIQKLGNQAYCMNHTEAGFPNIYLHYPMPWFEDPEFAAYFAARPGLGFENWNRQLVGSVGPELEVRFKTPFDLGWGNLVDFGHEFIGRAALERIAAEQRDVLVTLEWNADDLGEIYASQFRGRDVEPYDSIDERPVDVFFNPRIGWWYHADWVLAGGERIGTSIGRLNSVYYQRMISLAVIDKDHAAEGTELTVVWGRPGTPQKEVRVRVAPAPYVDLANNSTFDVEQIPHPVFA